MTTDNENYRLSFGEIEIEKIEASPFQRRRRFDEESLKELGANIVRDGLIAPIVVRRLEGGGYQLVAGERRFRAVRDYTGMTAIQAKIVEANDVRARRIGAAENLLREDLSAVETVEATVEIIDAELGQDDWYSTVGKTPLERVSKLLAKLDSVRKSKEEGYVVSEAGKATSHKFMGSVEKIFKNLFKPLKWRSFLINDLTLLMDVCREVREASVKHGLNKSRTKALAKLERFAAGVVAAMQKKKIMGAVARYAVVCR